MLDIKLCESRNICLLSVELLPNRRTVTLSSSLRKIPRFYSRGGFLVKLIMVDTMEFECLKDSFSDATIGTTAAREYVAEIEHAIKLIKERTWCTISELRRAGYRFLHKWIVVHCVYMVVLMLNGIPSQCKKRGISHVFSPREFVTGRVLDFKKDCRVPFGAYVEASEGTVITNDMSQRTRACISLGPSGNLQGSLKCFDLLTGKVLTRRTMKGLPLSDRVLARVNRWGKMTCTQQYENRLEFLDRNEKRFNWDNDELIETEGLIESEPGPHPGLPNEIPGVGVDGDNNAQSTVVTPEPTQDIINRAALTRATVDAINLPRRQRGPLASEWCRGRSKQRH